MIEQIRYLLEEAFRHDTLTLYFLMFGGGIFASLTPCTYPVLPLTVGYIGNQASDNRLRAFLLSLSLVAGLATVYALLGSTVAAVGGTFGSIMGKGWLLYAIAVYYLIMGLFLLDVFHFPQIRFFPNLPAKSAYHKGLVGAFLIGGISGLIVGPCTGPILAVALGAIALTIKQAQGVDYALQVVKGGILLFLFGLGQGTLILLAGSVTGFVSKLPKAGAWMEAVKKGFALLIIITASLLFVFVGQNTDFPSLTRLLAIADPPARPAPKSYTAMEAPAAHRDSREAEEDAESLAPDFTLASLHGDKVTLSRLTGEKEVVLVFFATWCVSCVAEVPEINQFAARAQKENIALLGINYAQLAEVVERFKQSQKIAYEILLDHDGTVTTQKYGVRGIPHIVGINRKGQIIFQGSALPDDKNAFINKLKAGS